MNGVTYIYCSHCKLTGKPLIKYSKRTNKSGFEVQYSLCRDCNREKMLRYYRTDYGKEIVKASVRRQLQTPVGAFKQRTRALVNYRLRMGEIKKPKKCSQCKIESKLEAHHKDYKKPLEVVWLCKPCHIQEDKKVSFDYSPDLLEIFPKRSHVGEKNPNSVLTEKDVRSIRSLAKNSDLSIAEIAKRFGVSYSATYGIVSGTSWQSTD